MAEYEMKPLKEFTKIDIPNADDDSSEDSDEPQGRLSISDPSNSAELVWSNINVTVGKKDKKKYLLKDVSGKVHGGLLAIMGSSGSGKSTLLNVLAHRLNNGGKATGEMFINGNPYNRHVLKKIAGYVMQDDQLFSYLTVRETLEFAAKLRMSPLLSQKEKKQRVEEIIHLLGLEHCQNVRVGKPLKTGISGGERKRLSIALELLNSPKILFLDEPTSGLDSVTAQSLIKSLKVLSRSGCTVICTIHQPQSKIFFQFDNFLLISGGKTVYFGPTKESMGFFEKNGYPCPSLTNPADHFLDVITPDRSKLESVEEAKKSASFLVDAFDKVKPEFKPSHKEPLVLPPKVPWLTQFFVLFGRAFRQTLRARAVFLAQLIQSIIMGLLVGFVWYQIGDGQDSISRRPPLLFFVIINQGIFGVFIMVNLFPSERVIVLRERASGMYQASAYFLAKILAEVPSQLIFPFVLGTLVYWISGLQPVWYKYLIYIGIVELCAFSATGMGLMISALSINTTLAASIMPVSIEIFRLFGGFLVPPISLPDYFVWIDSVSFIKYAYVAVALNEWQDLKLYCYTPQQLVNFNCPVENGEVIIERLGLNFITIWQAALILVAFIIFFRFVAYLGIRFVKK